MNQTGYVMMWDPALLANIVYFEEADTFYADASGAPNSFTNFTNLRSWKDQ